MPFCVHQINHGCVPKLVFCYAYGSAVSLICIMWVVAEGGNSAEFSWEIFIARLTADIKGSECNIMEKGSKREN